MGVLTIMIIAVVIIVAALIVYHSLFYRHVRKCTAQCLTHNKTLTLRRALTLLSFSYCGTCAVVRMSRIRGEEAAEELQGN